MDYKKIFRIKINIQIDDLINLIENSHKSLK